MGRQNGSRSGCFARRTSRHPLTCIGETVQSVRGLETGRSMSPTYFTNSSASMPVRCGQLPGSIRVLEALDKTMPARIASVTRPVPSPPPLWHRPTPRKPPLQPERNGPRRLGPRRGRTPDGAASPRCGGVGSGASAGSHRPRSARPPGWPSGFRREPRDSMTWYRNALRETAWAWPFGSGPVGMECEAFAWPVAAPRNVVPSPRVARRQEPSDRSGAKVKDFPGLAVQGRSAEPCCDARTPHRPFFNPLIAFNPQ